MRKSKTEMEMRLQNPDQGNNKTPKKKKQMRKDEEEKLTEYLMDFYSAMANKKNLCNQ